MCRSMVDIQSATAEITRGKKIELECGPMLNMMATLLNIGGALYKSSLILFLVQRRKVWLMHTARVSCSNAANTGERKTWTQREFCTWQNSLRGKSPGKCIYIYIMYQPRRWPNIVQSLVDVC